MNIKHLLSPLITFAIGTAVMLVAAVIQQTIGLVALAGGLFGLQMFLVGSALGTIRTLKDVTQSEVEVVKRSIPPNEEGYWLVKFPYERALRVVNVTLGKSGFGYMPFEGLSRFDCALMPRLLIKDTPIGTRWFGKLIIKDEKFN
jgi:hypothetical protein